MQRTIEALSEERVDILPGTTRDVKVSYSEALPTEEAKFEIEIGEPGITIVELGRTQITLFNSTNHTYSVFPDGKLLTIKEFGVAEVNVVEGASQVTEAFSEVEEGVSECPLCDKIYKTESGLKKHLENVHGTVV